MGKNLIIFDFDGVINNSMKVGVGIFKDIASKYKLDVKPTRKNYVEIMNTGPLELKRRFGLSAIESIRIVIDMRKGIKAKEGEFKIFPGIAPVLKELHENNDIVMVTSHGGDVKETVRRFGIEDCFDFIYKVRLRSRKSNKIERCVKAIGADKKRTFLVTDDDEDVLEAREAGIKSVGVTWGIEKPKEISRNKPDYVISSPKELLKMFG
jgi:phosphoglycolate phosphatase